MNRGTFPGWVQCIISKPSLGTLPQAQALSPWRRTNTGEKAREHRRWWIYQRANAKSMPTLCLIGTGRWNCIPRPRGSRTFRALRLASSLYVSVICDHSRFQIMRNLPRSSSWNFSNSRRIPSVTVHQARVRENFFAKG